MRARHPTRAAPVVRLLAPGDAALPGRPAAPPHRDAAPAEVPTDRRVLLLLARRRDADDLGVGARPRPPAEGRLGGRRRGLPAGDRRLRRRCPPPCARGSRSRSTSTSSATCASLSRHGGGVGELAGRVTAVGLPRRDRRRRLRRRRGHDRRPRHVLGDELTSARRGDGAHGTSRTVIPKRPVVVAANANRRRRACSGLALRAVACCEPPSVTSGPGCRAGSAAVCDEATGTSATDERQWWARNSCRGCIEHLFDTKHDVDRSLAEALDDLLALDAGSLDDSELYHAVVELGRQTSRLRAAVVRTDRRVGQAAACGRDNGSKAPGARLVPRVPDAKAAADHLVHQARSLSARCRTLPRAFAAGEITIAITSTCWRQPTEPDATPRIRRRRSSTGRAVQDAVVSNAAKRSTYWELRVDATKAPRTRPSDVRQRSSRSGSAPAGGARSSLDAVLDPIGGAVFEEELHRLCEQLRLQDERDGTIRTSSNAAPTPSSRWRCARPPHRRRTAATPAVHGHDRHRAVPPSSASWPTAPSSLPASSSRC